MTLQGISRDEILQVIDDHWMVESPDRNEHAFLFTLIQERHRVQFEQAFEQGGSMEELKLYFAEIDRERTRAEEILYWLYLDTELRKQRRTFADRWEDKLRENGERLEVDQYS